MKKEDDESPNKSLLINAHQCLHCEYRTLDLDLLEMHTQCHTDVQVLTDLSNETESKAENIKLNDLPENSDTSHISDSRDHVSSRNNYSKSEVDDVELMLLSPQIIIKEETSEVFQDADFE